MDFQSGGYTTTFSAGQTTATVSIPITDDTIAEGPEDFSAVLNIPTAVSSLGVNKGVADTASINIIDNDAVEVVFNPTQYTVNEGAGVVTLTLSANKVAECNYTVEVLTQDGSAKGHISTLSLMCHIYGIKSSWFLQIGSHPRINWSHPTINLSANSFIKVLHHRIN